MLSNLKFSLVIYFISIITYPIFSQDLSEDYKKDINKLYKYKDSNKDSTYYYANRLITYFKEKNEFDNVLSIYLFSNKSAIYFNDYQQIKNNLQKIDNILNQTNLDTINNIDKLKSLVLYDRSVYHYKLNDYKTTHTHLKNLINKTLKNSDSILDNENLTLVNNSYTIIAKMYSNDGKYDQAEEYYKKSIRLNSKKNKDYNYNINNTYRLLGELYQKQDRFKTSNSYLKKALNYSLTISKDANSIINEANNIARNYIALNQPDSAKHYLNYIKPYKDKNTSYGFLYYKSKAQLNISNNALENVENDYNEAISLLNKKWKGLKHPEIADIHQEFSNFYLKNEDYEKALYQNQLAINQVHSKDVINSSINNVIFLKLLKDKLLIQNKKEDYKNSINTSSLALSILDSLKPTFKNNTDKLFLIENAFPVFESGLSALYNSYKKNNNEDLIDKAFTYAEKSKSILLIEALLNTKATNYANIPKDIIEQEQFLKSKITYLEKTINTIRTDALEDELFNIKSQYRNLISELETNYKNYYNLKYNSEVINVRNLQNTLQNDELLITYFYGANSIYAIGIGKNTKEIIKVPVNDAFNKNLMNFHKEISNPKSNIETLSQNSNRIYTSLIEPFLQNTSAKKLILVTDGLLNYIPFSSLNISNTSIKYLIEDYAVSYVNSATLLFQLQEKQENNNKVLAFAPTFNSDNNNLLPLPNNKKEVKSILQHVNGDALTDTEASLQNFNTSSLNYGIIHLATHAIFNDTNPEYSFLAFSPNTKQEHLLYTKDLYNLKLNADLVTLSACESGIGELKRGEGLLSLARGFYFSGAKSIASTLWKINDNSTATLMDGFYSNLSKNNSKNVALQKAQLDFINTNRENTLSHPYYWSGFVLSGNTIPLNSTNYRLWIGLAVFLLLLLLLYFFKVKKRKPAKL